MVLPAGQEAAGNVAGHVALLHLIPAVALAQHGHGGAVLEAGHDIAGQGRRGAHVQADAGVGAHGQGIVDVGVGQVLGQNVAGFTIDLHLAPVAGGFQHGHPGARGVLAQHGRVQAGLLAEIQTAAGHDLIAFRQRNQRKGQSQNQSDHREASFV